MRKIVRKRAVSRVYTRGMGDLKMRSLAPVRSTSVEIVWSIRAEYMGLRREVQRSEVSRREILHPATPR